MKIERILLIATVLQHFKNGLWKVDSVPEERECILYSIATELWKFTVILFGQQLYLMANVLRGSSWKT